MITVGLIYLISRMTKRITGLIVTPILSPPPIMITTMIAKVGLIITNKLLIKINRDQMITL